MDGWVEPGPDEREISNVEKHGFVVALQADVETIDRVAVARLARRDQRAAAIGGYERYHGIGGVGGLAVEINPRIIVQQHAARENREQNMRRLRLAIGIRHRARPDGVERKIAARVGAAAAETPERRIGQRALVLGITEAALRIGLPYLQHAMRNRLPVAVEHPALYPDAFARGVRGNEVVGEGIVPVVLAVRRQPILEKRTDGLRWRNSL